jgi:DNA-binding transcriptional MerR regulator
VNQDRDAEWSIGQVAEKLGLSVHTLRFYESEGLHPPVRRSAGGRRIYTADDLDWLRTCLNLRATGMPIPVIRRYVQLVLAGDSEGALVPLLIEHRQMVLEKQAQLEECLNLINHKIDVYGDPEPGSCGVHNSPQAAEPNVTST